MTATKRVNKTVSFSFVDAYEEALYDYAMSAAHGKFGPYVKRLIERDRAGLSGISAPVSPTPVPMPAAVSTQSAGKTSVGKAVAKSFL